MLSYSLQQVIVVCPFVMRFFSDLSLSRRLSAFNLWKVQVKAKILTFTFPVMDIISELATPDLSLSRRLSGVSLLKGWVVYSSTTSFRLIKVIASSRPMILLFLSSDSWKMTSGGIAGFRWAVIGCPLASTGK